ncbi:MAG: protein kinase [Myxococcales bacterium]|nr:protein kinase [Myxococcales bacterium]
MKMEERVELSDGTVLDGRFLVHAVLGEGGMGCVYLADDLVLGHEVALKLLIPGYRGRPDREQRLLNEAAFGRRVGEHPSMPRLYGVGRLRDLDGCPYVAWEVVEGSDLNSVLLSRRRIPPRVATRWARQVADALCAMHRAGVVHRDVTVTNVFIDGSGADARVKLIDLSHAAFVPEPGAPSRRLTREFEVPGAHRFMPPEQTLAIPPHPKMDVFSFGVVLHEMLTGRNPFEHVPDRETYIDLQRAGRLHVPQIDRRGYPEVSESLVELVVGCTANDMAARLDMHEVRERLDAELTSAPLVLVSGERGVDTPSEAAGSREVPDAPDSKGVLLDTEAVLPTGVEDAPPPGTSVVGVGLAAGAMALEEQPRSLRTIVAVATVMVVLTALALLLAWPEDTDAIAPATPAPRATSESDEMGVGEALPRTRPAPAIEPSEPESGEPDERPLAQPADPIEAPAEPEPTPTRAVAPSATDRSSKRKPTPRVEAPAHETEECRGAVAAALSAEEAGAWVRLEILTRKRRCFGNRTQWAKLRAHALLETERFRECSALADEFEDPFVQKYARTCRAQQDRP